MFLAKKEQRDPITEQKRYGFFFPEEPVGFSANPAVLCTLKALLVFCACFGTVGGILSAFSVDYSEFLVLAALLLCSFVLAFLHYNAVVFNTVYPLLFFLFAFSIFQCRSMVNSGYQSFISILYEEYSDYFGLALTREVTLTYNDHNTAVTVAAIFVGFFLALLLNIAISTYMSLLLVLLMTFPILQIALYIERYPSPAYLFLILFSYVSVGILKRSRHFDLPLKKKKRSLFLVKEKPDGGEACRLHSYRANGPILVQTAALVMALSVLFMGASYSLLNNHDAQRTVSNSLKAKTDEYVKIFVQSGISGFFNRYSATGGISGGKLGGVSSVRPDYQTDLTVTFAPYGYDTLYLKAFTGSRYTGDAWLPPYPSDDFAPDALGFCANLESKRLAQLFENSGDNLKAKMKIENLDANPDYLYLPYYTDSLSLDAETDTGIFQGRLPLGEALELSFYPPVDTGLASSFPLDLTDAEEAYLSAYEEYCKDSYTEIPDSLTATLEAVKREIGTADTLEGQVLLIEEYFETEFTYTTNPGATPVQEDFVDYFLTKQKKGYCTHFASAAALLLRSYGYPARYVEGYVVTFADLSNATAVDENYGDYLQGENPLGETGVVEADITDGNAHAWVEVYKEGFGWIPVEVTPPQAESDASYSDFWSIFSGLFSVSETDATSTTTAELAESGRSRFDSFLGSTDFIAMPLLVLVLCLLLIPLLLWLGKKLANRIKIKTAFRRGDYAPFLSDCYRRLLKGLEKKKYMIKKNPSPGEIQSLLFSLFPEGSEEYACIERYFALLEKGCFSKKGVTEGEALWVKKSMNLLLKKL